MAELGLALGDHARGLFFIAREEHQPVLGRELGLRGGVVGLAGGAVDHRGHPLALAVDELKARHVHRAVREDVVDRDDVVLVALTLAAAVALLQRGGLVRKVAVVDGAGAALQVQALVGDAVGDDHVVKRLVGGEALGDLLAGQRRGRHFAVEDGDALGRNSHGDESLAHPVVRGDVVEENQVPALFALGHGLGDGVELGTARVLDLFGGRIAPGAAVELRVHRHQRHALQEAQGLVSAVGVEADGANRFAVLLKVQLVLAVLPLIHGDLDALDARLGNAEPDLLGGAELAVAIQDLAEEVEAPESDDAGRLHDAQVGVLNHPVLDLQELTHELLGVRDTQARPDVVVEKRQQRQKLQRRVLRRGSVRQVHARAAGMLAHDGRAKEHLPGDAAGLLRRAEKPRLAAFSLLHGPQVLASVRLVKAQPVDAVVLPGEV